MIADEIVALPGIKTKLGMLRWKYAFVSDQQVRNVVVLLDAGSLRPVPMARVDLAESFLTVWPDKFGVGVAFAGTVDQATLMDTVIVAFMKCGVIDPIAALAIE